jgi:uncharacterized lipoprotein YehR (DUF1307 family)
MKQVNTNEKPDYRNPSEQIGYFKIKIATLNEVVKDLIYQRDVMCNTPTATTILNTSIKRQESKIKKIKKKLENLLTDLKPIPTEINYNRIDMQERVEVKKNDRRKNIEDIERMSIKFGSSDVI